MQPAAAVGERAGQRLPLATGEAKNPGLGPAGCSDTLLDKPDLFACTRDLSLVVVDGSKRRPTGCYERSQAENCERHHHYTRSK
jgi:hypothetical protein